MEGWLVRTVSCLGDGYVVTPMRGRLVLAVLALFRTLQGGLGLTDSLLNFEEDIIGFVPPNWDTIAYEVFRKVIRL